MFDKAKSIKKLNAKIAELTTELELALDEEDYNIISAKLEKAVKLRNELSKPNADYTQLWAELIKVLGCGALLVGAMIYDSNGHVLPKTLDSFVPKIKP